MTTTTESQITSGKAESIDTPEFRELLKKYHHSTTWDTKLIAHIEAVREKDRKQGRADGLKEGREIGYAASNRESIRALNEQHEKEVKRLHDKITEMEIRLIAVTEDRDNFKAIAERQAEANAKRCICVGSSTWLCPIHGIDSKQRKAARQSPDTEKLKEALEIGRDAAHEVAQRFHEEMKGYREAEHRQVDADVATIEAAIASLSPAQQEPAGEDRRHHEEPDGPNHPGHHDGHTCEAMGQMLADFGSQRTTPEAIVAGMHAKQAASTTDAGQAFSCAKRAADPSNEFAACLKWCGNSASCQCSTSAQVDGAIDQLTALIRKLLNSRDAKVQALAESLQKVRADFESTPAQATPEGGQDLQQVMEFLLGEGDLGGKWFGDRDEGQPKYWWRNNLRAALAAQQNSASNSSNTSASQQTAEPVAWHVKFDEFRHFSGAMTAGREYVQAKKPDLSGRFFEGCDSLVVTPLYRAAPLQQVEKESCEICGGTKTAFGKRCECNEGETA